MIAISLKPAIHYSIVDNSADVDFMLISKTLKKAHPLYPNFKNWLYFTFRPGFYSGNRKIVLAKYENCIAGLALIKSSTQEKKICTFYVHPEFREIGVGSTLMDRAISSLSEERILISVSDEKNDELYPTLKKAGFFLTKREIGLYRKNVGESFYKI